MKFKVITNNILNDLKIYNIILNSKLCLINKEKQTKKFFN